MADIKKQLIEQVDGLLRKGEIKGPEYRTLVTKIELADPRFIKMALDKFQTIRKSATAEEEEDVKKANGATAPSPAPTPTPAPAPAPAKPAPAPSASGIGAAMTSKTPGIGAGTIATSGQTSGVGG